MVSQRFKKLKTFAPLFIIIILIIIHTAIPDTCFGESTTILGIDISDPENPGKISVALQIFVLMTIFSLAPSILIMMTSFTRIVIVMSLLRQAIGTHQMPPNQVVIGLSLFLTFFVMAPVWQNLNQQALTPFLEEKISQDEAIENAIIPIRKFMSKHIREKDLALMVDISGMKRPENMNSVPMSVFIPSFIISELKTAFQIGFLIYIPFLIIDMVVASILLSMGMMMLPPVMISLPFKLMLFVLADGWHLIVGSLVKSFF
jgi:flagellar biosynthetic protein FliP